MRKERNRSQASRAREGRRRMLYPFHAFLPVLYRHRAPPPAFYRLVCPRRLFILKKVGRVEIGWQVSHSREYSASACMQVAMQPQHPQKAEKTDAIAKIDRDPSPEWPVDGRPARAPMRARCNRLTVLSS
ncbi:hypothetical protein GGR53DRAFT_284135 [Hypoxylon sp. FL1150]|nr:hypothetical protein GGR53DRAFT_284135 [Hypoxylon sp. FL1150]